jgi:hypothetical protein
MFCQHDASCDATWAAAQQSALLACRTVISLLPCAPICTYPSSASAEACFNSDYCCSEYSKTLNEARLKVLAAREAAIQTVVKEARSKVREAAKNPNTYRKMMQDLLVQVRSEKRRVQLLPGSRDMSCVLLLLVVLIVVHRLSCKAATNFAAGLVCDPHCRLRLASSTAITCMSVPSHSHGSYALPADPPPPLCCHLAAAPGAPCRHCTSCTSPLHWCVCASAT